MKITRDEAVNLFFELGLRSADRWSDERLARKLALIPEMVDEDVELEDDKASVLLFRLIKALKGGESVEIAHGDEASVEKQDEPQVTCSDECAAPSQDSGSTGAVTGVAEKAIDEQKGSQVVERAEQKSKSDGKPKRKQRARNRVYWAGVALRKFGIDNVTDEHVAFVNDRCGLKKDRESLLVLRQAKRAIDAYLSGD